VAELDAGEADQRVVVGGDHRVDEVLERERDRLGVGGPLDADVTSSTSGTVT
jgi:hypothetical protein